MITTEAQLQQAVHQMGRMYRALATLHSDVLPQSRQQFALMAEGPLEEMRRLEQEISAYISHTLDAPDDPASTASTTANAA
jgi:hypothetical protein